jgi:4-amino-4-deoxy-L-arabinose transferase-like glycosyltransferase
MLALVGLTIAAGALHVLVQSQRPLWLDEACTYWTIQVPLSQLLQGVRTDGSPPLHFLLVAITARLFGASEFVLRLVSLTAATALVPGCYAVTRQFAERRAGLTAAAIAVVSPLVHYYGVEARAYSLVQLETLGVLYLAFRALRSPAQLKWWGLLAVAEALQLWTHGYAVFVVAALPLIFLLASPQNRFRVAARALAVSALATVLALPPLLNAIQMSTVGITAWVAKYWQALPPSAAILRSLQAFGFGAELPEYLPSLGALPHFGLASAALTVILLLAALFPLAAHRHRERSDAAPLILLLGFLILPLAGAWAYSAIRQPLYVVGRYDTIVLPAFLILIAVGLDRLLVRRWLWLGVPVAGAIACLTVFWFGAAARNTQFLGDRDRQAAEYVSARAKPGEVIVATGLRLAAVQYYLDRAGLKVTVLSFPSALAEHPGYFSEDRALADQQALGAEGERLAATLVAKGTQDTHIWIVGSGLSEVDPFLYRHLLPDLAGDRYCSRLDLDVVCLRPK